MTVIVWVLIMWSGGHPVVVDNIASRANCEALGHGYDSDFGFGNSMHSCRAVRKVVVR